MKTQKVMEAYKKLRHFSNESLDNQKKFDFDFTFFENVWQYEVTLLEPDLNYVLLFHIN